MQRLVGGLTPDEVEALAQRIEEALTLPPAPGTDPFVEAISDGRGPSEPERVALAVSSALKDFEFRRHLLADSLTASSLVSPRSSVPSARCLL
jgi:hypothetical protein